MSAKLDTEGCGVEVRTARVTRRCETYPPNNTYCVGTIQPGQRYVRHVVSPRHEFNGGDRWITYAECEPCLLERKHAGKTY